MIPPEDDKSYFYDGAGYAMRYASKTQTQPKPLSAKQKAKRTAKRRDQRKRSQLRKGDQS